MTDQTPDPWQSLEAHSTREIVADAVDLSAVVGVVWKGARAFGHNPSWVKVADVDAARALDAQRLQQAQQEIADLKAAAEWQTIDTAPKDGTDVLLCGILVPTGRPYRDIGRWHHGYWDWDADDSQPSHWARLRIPPLSLTPEAHHD